MPDGRIGYIEPDEANEFLEVERVSTAEGDATRQRIAAPGTDALVSHRLGLDKQHYSGYVDSASSVSIATPGAGFKVRLLWVGLSASEANTGVVYAKILLGVTTIYQWHMNPGGAFSRSMPVEGADGQALIYQAVQDGAVAVNITYEIVPV